MYNPVSSKFYLRFGYNHKLNLCVYKSQMGTVLIFLPDNLKNDISGYLYGAYHDSNSKFCRSFYIIGIVSYLDSDHKTLNIVDSYELVGSFSGQNNVCFTSLQKDDWIILKLSENEYELNVKLNNEDVPLDKCLVIKYNPESLRESQLLPSSSDGDYFKTLVYYLKKSDTKLPNKSILALYLIWILDYILLITNKLYYITRLSSVGLHLQERTKNLKWLLESYFKKDTLQLHQRNFIISILVDMPLGFIITVILSKWGTEHEIFHWIASISGDLVDSISITLTWIMGSPGGLKLNYPLNFVLGTFFLYHMYLWWIFLGLVRPLLEYAFLLFLKMGSLGCSFQIALLADIFSLVSFHLYSIYVYAAKLYSFQLKQIRTLSGIFFGRKRNPEPGKVDSYPYNNEQLFVATVCFTVLLFLLPTSLLRLGIVMIGGLLTRARYLLEISPLYSTFVWLLDPKKITTTIKLVPIKESKNGSVTLTAEPVRATWLETAQKCIPTVIEKPKPIEWKQLGNNLLNGSIIYQI